MIGHLIIQDCFYDKELYFFQLHGKGFINFIFQAIEEVVLTVMEELDFFFHFFSITIFNSFITFLKKLKKFILFFPLLKLITMNKTSIKAPNGEVNWDDLILNLVVASVIIFIILIPRFFFRVSKEDYEKFKKEHKEQ